MKKKPKAMNATTEAKTAGGLVQSRRSAGQQVEMEMFAMVANFNGR
jgi:hypothetical protein